MSNYLNLCDTFRPERHDESFFEAVKSDLPVSVLVGAYDPGTAPFYGEPAIQSLTNFTMKDGLPTNVVSTIYKDKKGELWFAKGGRGVHTFDGEKFVKVEFNTGL